MNDLPMLASAPLREQLIELLEERVLYGEWPPGTRVPAETELCAQLGVSRSVVRDAMRELAARGLVSIRRGVGTVVTEASDAAYSDAAFQLLLRGDVTVHEAVEARAALEEAIAGIAAEACKDEDLVALRGHFEAVAAARQADDMPQALEADLRFHLGILEATHLPVLITLLRPMQRIIWITSLPPESEDGSGRLAGVPTADGELDHYDVELHRCVLEALEARDASLARARMRDHFSFARDPAYQSLHSMTIRDAARLRSSLRAEMRSHAD
jgi:GntR family transcriptional repressor for pyruvate dehydrogenase complex